MEDVFWTLGFDDDYDDYDDDGVDEIDDDDGW